MNKKMNQENSPQRVRPMADRTFLANEDAKPKPESQIFVNASAIDDQGWVQLAPYGDFSNVDSTGRRVIQRFKKPDAETIVNEFNSLLNVPQRLLGLPWYIGHPDHARFRQVHTDTKAYGRVKKLESRDDGLYGNVKFGVAGKQLLDDEAFHGHSVNWKAMPNGKENGIQIFHPVSLKSVGFTNDPAMPVRPASLANEEELEDELINQGGQMIVPSKLKVLAGFAAGDDVTIEQCIAAIEKKMQPNPSGKGTSMSNESKTVELSIGDKKYPVTLANEDNGDLQNAITKLADNNKKSDEDLANEKKARAEERKARATLVVDPLVKAGKIVSKDRETKIEELCNADDFDAKAKEFANVKPVVKTTATSSGLSGKHAVLTADERSRQQKLAQLLDERAQHFPNETYDARFNAVVASEAGQQLFTQMQRPGANGD